MAESDLLCRLRRRAPDHRTCWRGFCRRSGPEILPLERRISSWEREREAGSSVLALDTDSSDLEEVLGVSNRIMVMAHGKQAGTLDRKDANDVSVMELATS